MSMLFYLSLPGRDTSGQTLGWLTFTIVGLALALRLGVLAGRLSLIRNRGLASLLTTLAVVLALVSLTLVGALVLTLVRALVLTLRHRD